MKNTTQEQNFEQLTLEITEKLKGLTYSEAKRALEHVTYYLERKLILS